MIQPDWWKSYFDQRYLDCYEKDRTERTIEEVGFLVETVPLKTCDRILDLACGYGRHSIAFAQRGYKHLTGLDYSRVFLEKAAKDADAAKVKVNFIQGDMRQLPWKNEFDVVLMMFSAYGYFSDLENRKVLGQVSQVLKPGGKFILDLVTFEQVLSAFQQHARRKGEVYRTESEKYMSGLKIRERKSLNATLQMECNRRWWMLEGKRRTRKFFLRFYTEDQLAEMLSEAGFEISKIYGDFKGNPKSVNNWRTIILAQKVI
ncbi:MAG: class I SAM-dependent methyltransferase [bacterium]|nr:class I SAM-dependent methyltransferase [bacterium]